MKTLQAISAITIALAVCALRGAAQEWTRFRGPNGTGISYAKTIPSRISDSNINWKVELPGTGHSSSVLWGERIFLTTTGDKSGGLFVLCLSAKDGRLLWRRDFPLTPFARHQFNSFAASTPAVDAERVFVVWNEPEHFKLAALNHDGKVAWQRDFGSFVSQHGCGVSPIVFGNKVILGNEQDDEKFVRESTRSGKSFVVAVDAAHGKTLWETPRRSTVVSYSTPCVYEPDKRTVSSPIIAGNIILGSCGSGGGGSFVTAINAGNAGAGRNPKLAYQIKKSAPYVPTGIAANGLVWLWSDGGIVTCLDAPTGSIHYQERVGGNYFGSPVWVDGRLFCVSTAGELVVLEASRRFNVLHRYPLNELCHSTPAVALGRMFIHTERHLISLGGATQPLSGTE